MLKQRPYRASRASHEVELWEPAYPSPQVLPANSNDNERVTLVKENNPKAKQLNRGESRNEPYANSELIYSNADTAGHWEKDGAVSDDVHVEEKAYLDLDLTKDTEIDSRWTADLHVKGELLKL